MQTILGSRGIIANGLAKALPKFTNMIRLVNRNPKVVNTTDQLVMAVLTEVSILLMNRLFLLFIYELWFLFGGIYL